MTKIVLAAVVASFALAACGDSKPPATKPAAPAATPAPTAPATPAPATDAKKDEKK